MTNLTNDLQKTISEIFELLDEGNLNHEIDVPLDAAISQFRVRSNAPFSHRLFHNTISDFTRHVYEHGLRVKRKLSFSQAHAEAISLLEKYRNAYSTGYDAAIVDAASPDLNGIELIIANMAEIIKDRERDKYIRWVLFKFLVSLDWETKTRIVELLLKKFNAVLPPSILECDPARFADNCHTLISNEISTNKPFHKIPSINPFF